MKSPLSRGLAATVIGVFILGIFIGAIVRPSRVKLDQSPLPSSQLKRSSQHTATSFSSSLSIFELIPVDDFDELARAASESIEEVDRESLLRVLLSKWAKKDPQAALAYAQKLGRHDLAHDCLLQMAKDDPNGALQWIEENSELSQQRYLTMAVYRGLARANPTEAVARVERLAPGAQRDRLLSIVTDEWAQQDIHAVFDWIETTELTPHFNAVYNQVMTRFIEQDLIQAAELVSDMEASDNKLSFSTQIAYKLAGEDIDYALQWLETLSGREKKYSMRSIVDRWASGPDASEALGYILENKDVLNGRDLIAIVATKMAHNNPEELAGLLSMMGETDQMIAAEQLASAYSRSNPAQGMEWVQSLDAGKVQDQALKGMVKSQKQSNVSQAFVLSEAISDDALRADQIEQVLVVWLPVNQQLAEQALSVSSALTVEEKKSMLDRVYQKLDSNASYLLPERP